MWFGAIYFSFKFRRSHRSWCDRPYEMSSILRVSVKSKIRELNSVLWYCYCCCNQRHSDLSAKWSYALLINHKSVCSWRQVLVSALLLWLIRVCFPCYVSTVFTRRIFHVEVCVNCTKCSSSRRQKLRFANCCRWLRLDWPTCLKIFEALQICRQFLVVLRSSYLYILLSVWCVLVPVFAFVRLELFDDLWCEWQF